MLREYLKYAIYVIFYNPYNSVRLVIVSPFYSEGTLREMKPFAQCHTTLSKWWSWNLNSIMWLTIMHLSAREKVFPGTKFCRVQCIEDGMNNVGDNTEDRKGRLTFTRLKDNLRNKPSRYTLLGEKIKLDWLLPKS